jgi:hypothetical protein
MPPSGRATYLSVTHQIVLRSQNANLEIATMMGHSAAVLFALATMTAAPDTEVSSLAHSRMAVGQKFEIETADRVYRGQLLDRSTGECRLATSSDGATFSPLRTVYLLGATMGPQQRQTFVLMHEVKVGMKMELAFDDLEQRNRMITGEVKAIKLRR